MSTKRYKVILHIEIDTLEFPIPADGKLSLSLKEEIQDAVESSVPVTLNSIQVLGVNSAEVRDND
jgi:hypothetical protein